MVEVIPLVSHRPAHRNASCFRRCVGGHPRRQLLIQALAPHRGCQARTSSTARRDVSDRPNGPVPAVLRGPWWVNASPCDGTEYAYLDASLKKIAQAVARRDVRWLPRLSQGARWRTPASSAAMGSCASHCRFLLIFSARVSRHHEHVELMEREPRRLLRVPAVVVYNGDDDHVAPDETRRQRRDAQQPPTEIARTQRARDPELSSGEPAIPRLLRSLAAAAAVVVASPGMASNGS